jgi:hypothetical protein
MEGAGGVLGWRRADWHWVPSFDGMTSVGNYQEQNVIPEHAGTQGERHGV